MGGGETKKTNKKNRNKTPIRKLQSSCLKSAQRAELILEHEMTRFADSLVPRISIIEASYMEAEKTMSA